MNILYDYQAFVRQNCGGISRYFFELIKHGFTEDCAKVSLFQGLHANAFDMKRYAEHLEFYFGIKHPRIPKSGCLLSWANKQLFRLWLRATDARPDIYHPTYYDHIDACDDKGSGKVLTVYDMIHAKMSQAKIGADATTARMVACVDKADRIIAISESTKRDLVEHCGLPEGRVEVIYLAASSAFRDAPVGEEDDTCPAWRRVDRPYVLYVGERTGYRGYKNFLVLLEAFALWNKRNEFRLVCVGGGQRWTREEARIIEREGVQESVRMFPGVTDHELRRFYSGAYVYVVPSLYEGFGIPALEAMACRAPVIAARTSSLPEVVGDAGLYFDPLSVEELIACLDTLADDEALRETLRVKGLQRSRLFSWEETALKTYNLYRRVL